MINIETTNDQLVGVRGDDIIVIMLPKSEMTKVEAMRQAAWLVVLADTSIGHKDFLDVLKAVENT